MVCVVFVADTGETESQLPPVVVEALGVNDTTAFGTAVDRVTVCVNGVVEPWTTVGAQGFGVAVTVGTGAPEATIVAFESVKAVFILNRGTTALMDPAVTGELGGMFAGTSVTM